MGWLNNLFGNNKLETHDEILVVGQNKELYAAAYEAQQAPKIEAKHSERMKKIREEKNKREKEEDGLKLVIDMAKLECKLCSNPQGILKVNLDTPTTQDKKTATEVEKDMKSLLFTGACTKSPNSASPCAAVMQTAEWKNTGTLKVQDKSPLLLKSTIKCNYGGVDITITDCGQINEPDTIETGGAPVPKEEAVVLDAYFSKIKNGHYEKISWAGVEEEVYVIVKTTGLKGRIIEVNIADRDGIIMQSKYAVLNPLQDNQDKKGLLSTKVRDDGYGIFKLETKPSNVEKEIKLWNDRIGASKDKKAYLCILVDAAKNNPDLKVTYMGVNPANDQASEKSKISNWWLDTKNDWFQLTRRKPVIVIDPGHGYSDGNVGTVSFKYTYNVRGEDGKTKLNDKKENITAKGDINELPQYVLDDPTKWIISKKENADLNERVLTYDVGYALLKELKNLGYSDSNLKILRGKPEDSKKYRNTTNGRTLTERVDDSNTFNADYYISIHADGGNLTSIGAHAIYAASHHSAESKKLGEDIMRYYTVVDVLNDSPKKDVKPLWIFNKNHTAKRVTLVELGFMSNPKEAKAMFNNVNTIAQELARGLDENIKNEFYGKSD